MSNIVTLFFPIIHMCYQGRFYNNSDFGDEDNSVVKSNIDLFSVERNHETGALLIEAKYILRDKHGRALQIENPSYSDMNILEIMPKKKAKEVLEALRYLATAIHLDMDKKIVKKPNRLNLAAIRNKLKNIKKDMLK